MEVTQNRVQGDAEQCVWNGDKAGADRPGWRGLGRRRYRAQQIFDALYKQRVTGLDEVTDACRRSCGSGWRRTG